MVTSRAVLVTGCSSGIGAATVRRLLADGWPVWATARDASTLAPLEAAGARMLTLDVTSDASRRSAVDAVVAEHGAVGALVNNAGYGQYGPVEQLPLDRWRAQLETNLFGAVALAQLVLPGMRDQRWGRVVNISSMGGRVTLPGGGAYHASKYALEAFSDALRLETRAFGVRVVLVEPGPVQSSWAQGAVDSAVEGGESSADDGADPYSRFRLELAASVAGAYRESRLSVVSPPEAVAAAVARALRSRRPRARYAVGAVAHGLVALKRVLPDTAWDAFVRRQFPTPRP